jgi:hypothetical protein
VVAFNLQEHRVVYRQDNADKIDFPSWEKRSNRSAPARSTSSASAKSMARRNSSASSSRRDKRRRRPGRGRLRRSKSVAR